MTTEPESAASARSDGKEGWNTPMPEVIPRPTYFPAAMAFGLTFLLWGIITSPVVLLAGLLVIVVSLAGWIGEMRHE
jgi:hypothetical protein